MKSAIKYIPIDCSFHDILLDRATRRKKIRIDYFSLSQEKESTEAVIVDVFTKSKEEFMKLDTEEVIRLDYIISVDNIPLPEESSCAFVPKK